MSQHDNPSPPALSAEELDAQSANALPDREAMSTLDPTAGLDPSGTVGSVGDTVDSTTGTIGDTTATVGDTTGTIGDTTGTVGDTVDGTVGTVGDTTDGLLADMPGLLDLDVNVDLDADAAAPISAAIAANANVAAPINASVAANIGSDGAVAQSLADQQVDIHQELDDVSAEATAEQNASVEQQ